MATRIAPCKGCPDRTAGERTTDCHTTCERFLAYKEERRAENKARAEYNLTVTTILEGRRRLKENPPPWKRQ
jgi:hypothetical protein